MSRLATELSAKDFFSLFEECPLCIEFTYQDADGNERIVFDPCKFHQIVIRPL